ncbi:type IV pilin [Natrinema sp. H-ect1]|uniref:type IV pilin n=1 Tax=Natrinema sp. H-ect1 TaxID=3242700 RepID=UPI00359ED018
MYIPNIKPKLVGSEDERAVSPVIGVILMVAITVILAAVIAAFVLDLGQGQTANAQAGIQFDHDASNEKVTITVNSIERADDLYVKCGSGSGSKYDDGSSNFDSAGATAVAYYGSASSGDIDCSGETIQIIGVVEGSESVLTQFDDHV